MKIRAILLSALLGVAAIAASQTTLKVERKYVVNESDTYKTNMTMASSAGELKISFESTQAVKKVYENGDADIESAIANMVVNMAGNEFKPPAQPPMTMRIDKFGVPTKADKNSRRFNFARFGSYFGNSELTVGQSVAFDQIDKENPKNHVKGTAKLIGIDAGKAQISITADSFTDGAEKPTHVEGMSTIDAATGKLVRFEGKATDLPAMGAPGMTISTATFVIEKTR